MDTVDAIFTRRSIRKFLGRPVEPEKIDTMLKTAPLAILVCGDLGIEKVPGNWVLDCSCASQNILLAAHASGLGAVFTGLYPEEDRMKTLIELFCLPEKVLPFGLIGVGYADGEPPKAQERFKPERISLNSWGSAFK